MLVLTRRVGESLMFGEDGDVKITVLSVKGLQVKIGIDAPASLPVHREEIFLRIKESQQQKALDLVEDQGEAA